MNVQLMESTAVSECSELRPAAEGYLAAVEEFDELWSAGKSEANQRRMDELMTAMLAYESLASETAFSQETFFLSR